MTTVILKRGKEKPVRNRHPWIFSGAIARLEGDPADGEVVDVMDHSRHWLARGYLNRRSQIVARLLTWERDEAVDRAFFQRRLERAIAARRPLADDPATDAYRLANAESDLLPGLVVDRYGEWVVVQVLTLGMEQWKEAVVETLAGVLRPRGIYERSDVDVRGKEGLSPARGVLWGAEPPEVVAVTENGHRFWVDVRRGHKTGFYLDQRENRARLVKYCAGRTVLNCFAYTGAFAVYALAGGAVRVVNVDSSAEVLELARRNVADNGFGDRAVEYVAGDVFRVLRRYRDQNRAFDLIILDPPKFAHSQSQVRAACRGYKDINLLGMQLLRPGGILFTFSCSGLVSTDLFQKVVFGASVDARQDVQIVERLWPGSDHPVLLSFPESAYLKGLVGRVV